MDDLKTFNTHIMEYNHRVAHIADVIKRVFNVQVPHKPLKIETPSTYNSFMSAYFTTTQNQLVNDFNQVAQALQDSHIFNHIPALETDFNWADIDKALTAIENQVNKY